MMRALRSVIAGLLIPAALQAQKVSTPDSARVVIADVHRFLDAFDALAGARTARDSVTALSERYLIPGSPGLRDFVRLRIGSEFTLLNAIQRHPAYYAHLRSSLRGLDAVEPRVRAALQRFERIYPDAVYTDVYFVVGILNTGGTVGRSGLLIGAEMYGRDAAAPSHELAPWARAVLTDLGRIEAIVVHELMHANQSGGGQTLLARALNEGVPDFLTELAVGTSINQHIQEWADPRVRELWQEFQREMMGTDASRWLYNGANAGDRPADLGYYMGYRIAKAYYEQAADRTQAIRDLLRITDAVRLLEQSGFAAQMK